MNVHEEPGEVVDLSKHARPRYPAAFANTPFLSDVRSLFPLLLAGLAARQGNLELLLVYYLARLLGRLNVAELASYEGRDLGSKSADELVADQEATFVRKAQQEVLNSLGLAILFNIVIFFGLTAVVVWQVSQLLVGLLTPVAPDPLAF